MATHASTSIVDDANKSQERLRDLIPTSGLLCLPAAFSEGNHARAQCRCAVPLSLGRRRVAAACVVHRLAVEARARGRSAAPRQADPVARVGGGVDLSLLLDLGAGACAQRSQRQKQQPARERVFTHGMLRRRQHADEQTSKMQRQISSGGRVLREQDRSPPTQASVASVASHIRNALWRLTELALATRI